MSHHGHQHGPSYAGTVLLELGVGTGALIVHCGPDALGREIEIAGQGVRTHAEVRARHLEDGTVYCAVYPSVPAGDYVVEDGLGTSARVRAGEVTEIRHHLPDA